MQTTPQNLSLTLSHWERELVGEDLKDLRSSRGGTIEVSPY